MSKALDNFIIGVKHLIQTAIDKAPFDKTYNGRVLSVNGDKYTVLINGKEYPNTTVQGGGVFAVDDMVKVIFPQNNANLRYIMSTGGGGGDATNAVLYTPQSLTDAQKSQARTNIGVSSGGGDLTGAVRYDAVQSLTTTQKTQARSNIGAGTYTKPVNGIPENDLSAEVQAKLNSTTGNIITITTEDADPLYPYMSSKTLAEIKASFAEKSEQFVFYNNISYKLEKIITDNGVEKAVFYSTARLVSNALTYYTCEIYDGEFGYSAADFHTYTGGEDLTGAVRYDAVQSLTDGQKAQARGNIGAYAKPSGGIPKTDLSSDVQNKLDEAITSVNGKTGISVVLGAEDIDVDRESIYGGTTDLEDAVNDLYERVSSRVQIITWVNFEWDAPNNEWVSDLTWAQIQDAYLSGYTVQARLHIGITPMILDYAGISISSGYERHVFYAATSSNIVVVEMSYDEPRDHDIELSYKPYNQDLTPYRTAAEQDVIDNTKLTDAPKDGKQYARKNGSWTEVVGNVQTVNGQTGAVVLKAENIDTNKQGQTQDFVIESNLRFNNSVKQNGINVNPVDVINALNSGDKVNISVNLSGGSIWDEQPVRYKLDGNHLILSFLTTIGLDYSPSVVVFSGYTTSSGWSMSELQIEYNADEWYYSANSLPTGVYTIERYLEELEARIAALENQ